MNETALDTSIEAAARVDPTNARSAGDLLQAGGCASPELTNLQLWERLGADRTLDVVPIVEDGRPIGLVNRNIFMEAFARPFAREVFGRRSCIAWMDKEPLVVDAGTPIEALAAAAVRAGAKVLKDGFIATREGSYAGRGSGFALLEAMSALERQRSRQIVESVDYASRIQRAQLRSSARALAASLPDHALVWEPRDVVGGDCYFFRSVEGGLLGAIVDCTGHGVPGAFMSLIALSHLDQAVVAGGPAPEPAELLAGLNRRLLANLGDGTEGGGERSDDGLDGVVFVARGDRLEFASARLPVILVPPAGAPEVVLGDRVSVGYPDTPADQTWTSHERDGLAGHTLVVATDGVFDQIGGPRRLGFGRRRLVELAGAGASSPARDLAASVWQAYRDWQGGEARRDDVTLLTARLGQEP